MSYEPTLIIEKKDLDKFESELQRLADLEDDKVAKYLHNLIRGGYCNFKNMKLFVFQPEFSAFNIEVRGWLDSHNIEYGEDN